MTNRIAEQIAERLRNELFNVKIMSNLFRPHFVERLVAIGLGDGFKVTSADWSGWDIEHANGARIEVKQSAALQTWTGRLSLSGRTTPGSFDIAPRTGYWADNGANWVAFAGRCADVYIFAWHPIEDKAQADQRDPNQWLFFVVDAEDLPSGQKSISRRVVEARWRAVGFSDLRGAALAMVEQISTTRGLSARP